MKTPVKILSETIINCWNTIDYGFSERVINSIKTSTLIDGKKKITLLINSHGGCIFDAWAILDYMKLEPLLELTTIGIGQVQSAALALLISGHNRYITEHCICMIHSHAYHITGPTRISYPAFKNQIPKEDELYRQHEELYINRTKLTKKKFKELYSSDEIFFNAKQALELGFVDGVI